MDWFLYDNGLRHEMVKDIEIVLILILHKTSDFFSDLEQILFQIWNTHGVKRSKYGNFSGLYLDTFHTVTVDNAFRKKSKSIQFRIKILLHLIGVLSKFFTYHEIERAW